MKEPFTQHYFKTSSLDFSCTLASLGFKLLQKMPMTRVVNENGTWSDTFYFEATCESQDFGSLDAKECYRAFVKNEQSTLEQKNPEAYQAIDYMATALQNRLIMLDCMKEKVTALVMHKVGDYECYLPLESSEELKQKMQKLIAEVV